MANRDIVVERWTGAEASRLRLALRLSIEGFAQRLGVSSRAVDKWESRGDTIKPRPETQAMLDTALSQASVEAQARFESTDPSVATSSIRALYDDIPIAGFAVLASDDQKWIASELLKHLWLEPGLMHEALDSGSVGSEHLLALKLAASRLGTLVVRVPPETLMPETFRYFYTVRRLISNKQTLTAQRQLATLGSMFATVLAEILFNQGQFQLASQWYGVGLRAAQEAEDQYLADISLAGSTYLPTYKPDPQAVLTNVAARLDNNETSSPAIAWLWGFRAKAHAALGNQTDFQKSIDRARKVLELSSPDLVQPGIFSFLPEKLAFYEARGWVELGNTEAASSAAKHAMSLYDVAETTEPALTRFEQASAFAQAGEFDEACRIATAALLDPNTYHGVTVVSRAHEFDQQLGGFNTSPVRQWREVLDSVRRPPPASNAALEHDA
jgi:transcriptional regulator with XRE-family HTH domain